MPKQISPETRLMVEKVLSYQSLLFETGHSGDRTGYRSSVN